MTQDIDLFISMSWDIDLFAISYNKKIKVLIKYKNVMIVSH